MENHPIPQDVTGFKFKLIGSMTVKQFLYLLGFGILATVAFVLHVSFFIRIPLVLLFAGIGAALAFLPIEGRPMDVMIANFAKTIPSENRYIFKKRGASISSYKIFDTPQVTRTSAATAAATVVTSKNNQNDDKRAALISRLRNSPFRPDQQEVTSLNNIHNLFEGKTVPLPQEPVVAQSDVVEKSTEPPTPLAIGLPTETTQPQTSTETAPSKAADAPARPAQSVPDVGNVILGSIHDPRSKPLQNILVEVIDKNGTPVRAFKTNAKGQFAAATPLPNGDFTVHFEDPGKTHEFKDMALNLSGQIVSPIEITSIDAREKLRQELFGTQSTAAPIMAVA